MELIDYFDTDDGSLPEVVVTFVDPLSVRHAFEFLFSCGARDVTAGGGKVWQTTSQTEKPFCGAGDVDLVISGKAEPFHVVLGEIAYGGCSIPDLGVFVDPTGFTLDYRMGAAWGYSQIQSLFGLLRQLKALGGTISVPWWGHDGERIFAGVLSGA